jgi:hypothetical protein
MAPAPIFQPAFTEALRWSTDYGSAATLRLKVPVGLGGDRLQAAVKAGDGGLTVWRATVARAGSQGALAGSPVELTFGGESKCTVQAGQQRLSDPALFPVTPGEELYVSVEVQGSVGTSAISAFPDSFKWPGPGAELPQLPASATPQTEARAVAAIYVEAAPGPVFVAIGDSITEGYISGTDDTRNAWPFVTHLAPQPAVDHPNRRKWISPTPPPKRLGRASQLPDGAHSAAGHHRLHHRPGHQ